MKVEVHWTWCAEPIEIVDGVPRCPHCLDPMVLDGDVWRCGHRQEQQP